MRVLIGRDDVPRRKLTFRWLWEPRDTWLGIFWNVVGLPAEKPHSFPPTPRLLLVYVCVVPCLPVVIAWRMRAGAETTEP